MRSTRSTSFEVEKGGAIGSVSPCEQRRLLAHLCLCGTFSATASDFDEETHHCLFDFKKTFLSLEHCSVDNAQLENPKVYFG